MVGQGFQYGPKGRGFVQRGILAYRVDDSLYTTVQRLDARRGPLTIGSKVRIEYARNDPKEIRITSYLEVVPRCSPRSYYTTASGQRTVLRLYNTILTSHTSTLKGDALDSTALEVTWQGDTLLAFPIGRMGGSDPHRYIAQEGKRVTLTDLNTGLVYATAAR